MTKIQKTAIALRKDDETAFVNPTTYWSLTLPFEGFGETCEGMIELRVRHRDVDSFEARSCNAAERDDIILVSELEWMDRRQAIVEYEGLDLIDAGRLLATRGVRIASDREQAILSILLQGWRHFCAVFEPSTNL